VSGAIARARGALLRPAGLAGVAALLALAWLAAGIFTVPATSLGVTRLFGAVVDGAVAPGVHWWWPPPVGRVDRVEVTPNFSITIGYAAAEEPAVQPGGLALGRWLTGDTNILELRAKVNYRVTDPARFLFGSEDPRQVLRDVVGSALTEATSGLPVDELLTSGRLALIDRVQKRSQALLDATGVGLAVIGVNVESIEPPATVLASFQEVQNAKADRERAISEAQAYANGVLPVSRGEADGRISAAEAFRNQRVSAAEGAADAFSRLAAEHRREPQLLEERLYLETIERVLPRVKRYVITPDEPGSMAIRIVE
jgi:membrane protease subunit HflK